MHKTLSLIALALLSSCTLLVPFLGAERCVTETARCEGNILHSCSEGYAFSQDCDQDRCNAEANACVPNPCGNGITETSEDCDDGNLSSGDGCSDLCQTEFCGDQIIQGNEECDDGNTNNGDGCESDCSISTTFTVGNGPQSVFVADTNNDNKPDIITANLGSNNVSVLFGNGNGTFRD